LGSSATAIVGGSVRANHLAGVRLAQNEVMGGSRAGRTSGNVSTVRGMPTRCYGFNKSAEAQREQKRERILAVGRFAGSWHGSVVPVVAIPILSFHPEARRVLPAQVSRADAIFIRRIWGCCREGLKPVG